MHSNAGSRSKDVLMISTTHIHDRLSVKGLNVLKPTLIVQMITIANGMPAVRIISLYLLVNSTSSLSSLHFLTKIATTIANDITHRIIIGSELFQNNAELNFPYPGTNFQPQNR